MTPNETQLIELLRISSELTDRYRRQILLVKFFETSGEICIISVSREAALGERLIIYIPQSGQARYV